MQSGIRKTQRTRAILSDGYGEREREREREREIEVCTQNGRGAERY